MTPYNKHCISPATHNTWLPITITVSVLLYTTHDSIQQLLYQSCYTQHISPYNNHCISPATHNIWLPMFAILRTSYKCMQTIILFFHWVQFPGNISMHPWEIDRKRLGSSLLWTQKMTIRKITKQRVAFKFCVSEGTFSNLTIKKHLKQKLFLKHCKSVLFHCLWKTGWFSCGWILIYDGFRDRKQIRSEFLI